MSACLHKPMRVFSCWLKWNLGHFFLEYSRNHTVRYRLLSPSPFPATAAFCCCCYCCCWYCCCCHSHSFRDYPSVEPHTAHSSLIVHFDVADSNTVAVCTRLNRDSRSLSNDCRNRMPIMDASFSNGPLCRTGSSVLQMFQIMLLV